MLLQLAEEANNLIQNSQRYLKAWLLVLAALWLINILNWLLGSRFNALGLLGIVFSPLLHANVNHLFFNSIPLFVLGLVILSRDVLTFYYVTAIIIIIGNALVWLFGRNYIHIGASGLVSGYFGYILTTAYISPSSTTVIIAACMIYYFGGIFFGIFPSEDKISWESHLFGFAGGLMSPYILYTL